MTFERFDVGPRMDPSEFVTLSAASGGVSGGWGMRSEHIDRIRRPWAHPDQPPQFKVVLFPRVSRARDIVRAWRWRALDAWAVLRGRAEIG